MPNRIVAFLTPIFAAVSGFICTFVGDNIPGANLDEAELTAFFVAGAGIAAAAAWKWLEGWQKHEDREAASELYVEEPK